MVGSSELTGPVGSADVVEGSVVIRSPFVP
jgi:hypothetical protein